ncbi:S-DNA-T family DNA segregation ATPase FtsK/SpoIIIE [Mycolicibacterium iranicum]|uniref:S-DNA-T family DNA segregation ATPase FtsK/SpoIIIE n=1 Tax=Mycolicibacterium iranicum TaxID=912594 RepID=A0A839Q3D7_MYCIR|nr:type VII secretion protein EccCa [Mycolicibacterium iranicum]MBB2989933.1 S-DNA-T family DNA segregation ATPase FtsK/SpoIIIE [Mycolicibacterium iranicum]
MQTGRVVIEAPPDPPAPVQVSPLARLMPVAMIVAMGGMTALYLTSTDSAGRSPMFLFFPVMMLMSLVGTLAYGARGQGRPGELATQRAEYLRYLDEVDDALGRAAQQQHRQAHETHPAPESLWTLAGSTRMWERDDNHPDFCRVRVGVGTQPAATAVVPPPVGRASADDDPVTSTALQRLVEVRATVDDVPVVLPLREIRTVTVTRATARALVCQAAMMHHPDVLTLDADDGPDWDWIKWLPHQDSSRDARHRIVLTESAPPPPSDSTTIVAVRPDDDGDTVDVDGQILDIHCDRLSTADATACARRIAGRVHDPQSPTGRSRSVEWPALMGVDDPEALDPGLLWSRERDSAMLRAPIGVAEDGTVLELDIKEAAAKGMGPHGLCVGATGSGKSEFLRTLVLGMVAAHPPELLNLVLVDFKGGATFLGLEKLHHVSAVITNLADEAPLVSRMREALAGEITRRQEMLRAAGNLTNIAEYAAARSRAGGFPPLPALFVLVDEFSELLSQHPEFVDLFVAIGRLGRSLGIHLLLASQRLDEGRLRGLETHLSYRICLKTFSASDSRAVLGVPDAYHLPSQPGAAYLKTASGELTRFQASFVSGAFTPRRRGSGAAAVRRFARADQTVAPAAESATSARPLLETVLAQLAGHGEPAHRVWLAPLGESPRLADLLPAEPSRHLTVPVGVVDCPFEQRRELLTLDLSGAAGNVAVVGAPRTGKSTALRTILCALAATHGAAAVQFYCLDFGGGELAALRDLPHVGAVAGRRDADLCRRVVAQIENVLRAREAAPATADRYGEVFLVVDGWATLRQEFDGLEPKITALAAQGLSYGIHVMIAASRWADLRPALKDQIGTRIELRLGDPADSDMDRRRARELADRPAGRGLTRDGRETAIAMPDERLVRRRDDAAAPRVELLPTRIDRRAIAGAPTQSGEVVLGVGERDLSAVAVDFAEHPHLLILGESGCGKTALLRLLCTELVASRPSVRLEIVDFRRTLLGVVETSEVTGYSVSAAAVTARLAALTEILDDRMPGEHVTQRQLRDRSWWSGPDIYVVVDDYDLVAGGSGNPLTPLTDFLPHAKDLGLHVIVARRSGGAARAMFDPLPARMRDMGCAGLMMSASPDDGVLLGAVRPRALPPGRGTLVMRGRPDELIQVGWVDPPP